MSVTALRRRSAGLAGIPSIAGLEPTAVLVGLLTYGQLGGA